MKRQKSLSGKKFSKSENNQTKTIWICKKVINKKKSSYHIKQALTISTFLRNKRRRKKF